MKLFRFIKKRDVVIFLLGAVIFGGVGTVVATNIASSSVNYTTNKNANVANVEDALDDLYDQIIGHPITCYNGTCGKLSYRYWNDGFNGTSYQSNTLPTNNYATRALLEQNYGSSNFVNRPYYIRSILIDGSVVGHQSCLLNNNKELCLEPGYWAGILNNEDADSGLKTKNKLQRDMQVSLGLTIADASCYSRTYDAYCYVGSFDCNSHYYGNVGCGDNITYCTAYGDGSAKCYEW